MPITRRKFLKSCAEGAAVLRVADLSGCAGTNAALWDAPVTSAQAERPDTVYRPLTEVALETARSLGSTYADIRVVRYRDQETSIRTQAAVGTTNVQHVPAVIDQESFGFGVRVLVNGTWGFAASSKVERAEVARVTREAVGVAKANAALTHQPVQLAPVTPAVALYRTPFSKDPFTVSPKEKLDFLRRVDPGICTPSPPQIRT